MVDATGVISKKLNDVNGNFRGYLNADFDSGTATNIYKVVNFIEIDDPNNNFDPATGIFTAPVTGKYKTTLTTTLTNTASFGGPTNFVIGLVNGATNTWVMRFSISDDFVNAMPRSSATGVATTFVGVVQLTAGQTYYFGAIEYLRLIANPTGTSGSGLGSYFEIELVKN